jgi:putative transposase
MIAEDNGKGDVIPKSMQLVAGRMAQEYNLRKNRKGAFWEDRYHATAIDCDAHLFQCLKYVDLNMVRAGVVNKQHKICINEALKNDRLEKDSKWSESIAVGRKSFVEEVHKKLGIKVKARKVEQVEESFLIREPVASYSTLFEGKNIPLRTENTYLWDLNL